MKLTNILLGFIVVLLIILLIDRARLPGQLLELHTGFDRQGQQMAVLQREVKQLTLLLDERLRPGALAAVPGEGGAATDIAVPDGVPVLDRDFLLPYRRDHLQVDAIGGTRRTFASTPRSFNPILSSSSTASDVHSLINDTLCDQHPETAQLWSQKLATSCMISDDFTTFTFTIRKGVLWQRPPLASEPGFEWLDRDVELTAHDFVATLETILDPAVECPHRKAYYEDCLGAEAIDDHTLVVRWKKPLFTNIAFSLGLDPLPRHIYGRHADGSEIPAEEYGVIFNEHWFDEAKQIVGVGPYLIEKNEPDKQLVFRRNPSYWGAGMHFERLVWDAETRQPEAQLTKFKNGEVPAFGLSPTQFKSEVLDREEPRFAPADPADPKAGREGQFGWEKTKRSAYSYIGWNLRSPLFGDKRVRWAMAYAFPKERIINQVYFGIGEPQVANVHPDSDYFNPALEPIAYDLDAARELLDAAGWVDSDGDGLRDKVIDGESTPLQFVVKCYANSPEWDSALLIFSESLREIGVAMTHTTFEWKEMLRIYHDRDFDAVTGGWRFGLEVDFVQVWHSRYADEKNSSNFVGFRNQRADEIADALRATFDREERIRLAQEFQEIIYQEQPYCFFRSGETIFIWQHDPLPGPIPPDRFLDGVIYGLEHYHPLQRTDSRRWFFED